MLEAEIQDEVMEDDSTEKIFQRDPEIFLLNYLLMSVQFFENYERDVHLVRENWFNEIPLESHHKKCFYADSLSRLAGANVKFLPRHGTRKNSSTSLHPYRIYVSSDNVEAAHDPSALGHCKRNVWPQYQFIVKTNEKIEKSGFIQLVEYKTKKETKEITKTTTLSKDFLPSCKNISPQTQTEEHSYMPRKSNFDTKNKKGLKNAEKFNGYQNKEMNLTMNERRTSLKYFTSVFFKPTKPEARVKPTIIHDFRMHSILINSHEIPSQCFQKDLKQKLNSRRNELKTRCLLNSASFKGYFCDLLIEKLAQILSLDYAAVEMSSVLDEFIIINQSGAQYNITPVIKIRDWKNYIAINKRLKGMQSAKKLIWPSSHMQKIINILPCNAVPVGYPNILEGNFDWKLVFPKAEEFLFLHLMHSQVRCYFFALLIYKSFIETEINDGSLGPRHLLHHLFWRVQKNFCAWPEDRPGETLLIYLQTLYKKIQNKYLCDFFITSQNLFANSLPKDLHKAQAIIKKIIENPVPYVVRAIRNLHLESNFYPPLDTLKLHTVLSQTSLTEKSKIFKKKKRKVHFGNSDDNDEQQWKKNVIKHLEHARKYDKEEQTPKLTTESINIKDINFNARNTEKCNEALKILIFHFIEMRKKSLEFQFSSQALFYLSHARKLIDLLVSRGGIKNNIKFTEEKLNKLMDGCPFQRGSQELKKPKINASFLKPENTLTFTEKNADKKHEKNEVSINPEKNNQTCGDKMHNTGEESVDENKLYETKL